MEFEFDRLELSGKEFENWCWGYIDLGLTKIMFIWERGQN